MAESIALYKVKQAEYNRTTQIAEIESAKAANMREAELQSMETERLRSSLMSQATVRAEAKVREAEGILAVYNAQADGLRNLMSATTNPDDVLRRLPSSRSMRSRAWSPRLPTG